MNIPDDTTRPVLSALVPSRERAEALKFSLDSLGLQKNNVEALVWVDDDDPQLERYQLLFDNKNHIKMFVKPRVGYRKSYVMLNYLAEQVVGDWLWPWGDDAYMGDPDWYDVFIAHASLAKPKEEPVVYNLSPDKNGFPIVSRKYLDILGHIGGSATVDLWTRRVVQNTDIERPIAGMEPIHRKNGRDPKLGDLIDNTYFYVEGLKETSRYFGGRSPGVLRAQHEDNQKILDWINQNKRAKGAVNESPLTTKD